jgi:fatty acid desaturase
VKSEKEIKRLIGAALPSQAFVRHPLRLVWILPHLAIIGLAIWSTASQMPILIQGLAAVLAGNSYACLMFLGHEVAHGAVVKSRFLQNLVLGLGGIIFVTPPRLWRAWHNSMHHRFTNIPDEDPDNFGKIEDWDRMPIVGRWLLKLAPGSFGWFGAVFLMWGFTAQSQAVLWVKSRRWSHRVLDRKKAGIEVGVMVGIWIAVAIASGLQRAVFTVMIPMAVANAVVMSYIITNHWIRPLSIHCDSLGTTMSVKTWTLIDRLHFHFSHHVEHHFFPNLGSQHYPLVRKELVHTVSDRFICPSHLAALTWVIASPRLYDGLAALTDPSRTRRVAISSIEESLRSGVVARDGPVPDKRKH